MSTNHSTSNVRMNGVTVRFGEVTAVNQVTIDIASGEFFTLLGPSGCGKTTLLRAIAGFNRQNEGTIHLGEQILDDVPAYRRDTGMVFQNYAVFPHLSVWDNIAYGLKSRGIKGEQASQRITEVLEMVDLVGYEKRMPKQLSGGQQQRVVIARAVAIRPRVLLMDEPLANLDAKLRVRLRNDLKALQRTLGITTIYVTHDQEEALSLSDRIAVMSHGHVLQIGSPEEIYSAPATLQVAQFIGEGNFLHGQADGHGHAQIGTVSFAVSGLDTHSGPVWLGFRPQDASFGAGDANTLRGQIRSSMYLGSYVRYEIDCGLDKTISVQTNADPHDRPIPEGSDVTIHVPADRMLSFSGDDREDDEL